MMHKLIKCNSGEEWLCCANGKKCSYCGAHGTGEFCQAADCERVGSELKRHANERKLYKSVMPPALASINFKLGGSRS